VLHIATVHFGSPRWIPIQVRELRRHLHIPYTTWTSLEGIDPSYGRHFDRVIEQSGPHADKLNHLAIEIGAEASDDDLLIFLDGDAFPIADPMPLIESGLRNAPLLAQLANDLQDVLRPADRKGGNDHVAPAAGERVGKRVRDFIERLHVRLVVAVAVGRFHQQHVGEQRTAAKHELVLRCVEHVGADDVAGHQVRRALHALKYGGERRLAVPLGAALAERWSRAGIGAEMIVPVPVHADRARERGYDQAVLLSQQAASGLGLPMRPMLERTRATRAQYELGHDQRAANVRDAFGVTEEDGRVRARSGHVRAPSGRARSSEVRTRELAGRWILLVDDVVTTGSTLASCAETLLEAGAFAVSAITVARER